jgi:hypothetical protein
MDSQQPNLDGDPTAAQGAVAPPSMLCKNCGAVLFDRFCASCGQAGDVHVLTTAELFHELLEGLTHSDSRLWRTLMMLWFKPGKLTQEFVAGKRVAYLPPLRLYLVLSVVFFLLASFLQPRGEVIHFDHPADASASNIGSCEDIKFDALEQHPALSERIRHACRQIVTDNGASLMHIALSTMSKAMFIFLPLVAVLHMLMYWRPRYPYAEHLVFFVHLHAFYFSVAIVMLTAIDASEAWPRLQGASDFLRTLLGWSLVVYTVISVRRVFAKSITGAIVKTVALSIIYLAVYALAVFMVFAYALLQL